MGEDFEKEKFKLLRRESIPDLIIRVIAFFSNFRIMVLDKSSLMFKAMVLAIGILFVLNILLETLMYRKARLYKEDEENIEWHELSMEDRTNYDDMYKAVEKSLIEIPILVIIITIILGFNKNSSMSSVIGLSIASLFIFTFFLKHSYNTLKMFYKDKTIAKKRFIKENLYVVISILLGVIFAFSRSLEYGDGIKFVLFMVQMIVLYPNFKWRNERGIRVLKVREYKEDKLH